ncbi:MAG: ribonuclease domain-containing protein [Burkholderiaceae bacterium]
MAVFAYLSRPALKVALTSTVMAALLAVSASGVAARELGGWGGFGRSPQETSIALAELPAQGQQTYRAILQGGPFRHDKDGSVFGNRERQLPRESRGHYREYTVETPGARDRGARRIVCGGERRVPEACWYTADHYASFRRIVP